MSSPVWPHDALLSPQEPRHDKQEYHNDAAKILCFLATPYGPNRERWDSLFVLIKEAAKFAESNLPGVRIEILRADKLTESTTVHSDMWRNIRRSDVFIADVTGQNGNVLFELGVAAAWLPIDRVIILRERTDETHLFNISPIRHIEYDQSFPGLKTLAETLAQRFITYAASIPYIVPKPKEVELPFYAPLNNRIDCPELYTPDLTHRVITNDFLEFGSPFSYQHSWMSLSDLLVPNVNVKAEIKLTHTQSEYSTDTPLSKSFIGVMVRGQNTFMNMGHLVLVKPNGTGWYTVKTPYDTRPNDRPLKNPKLNVWDFIQFDITIDEKSLSITLSQGDIQFSKTLVLEKSFYYVYTSGRIYFIAGFCRVGIKNIEIRDISSSTDNANELQHQGNTIPESIVTPIVISVTTASAE